MGNLLTPASKEKITVTAANSRKNSIMPVSKIEITEEVPLKENKIETDLLQPSKRESIIEGAAKKSFQKLGGLEFEKKLGLSTKARVKRDLDENDSPSPRSQLKGTSCTKKLRTSNKGSIPSMRSSISWMKSSSEVLKTKVNKPKKEPYMRRFFKLFDDDVIQDFLWNDGCAKLLDKYLLAMVYVYFRRADLNTKQYNRLNFFAALFLAHDMEEDDEEIKQEIFPWALGPRWKSRYRSLILRRDALLQKMKFRSLVSRLTCSEVFELCPEHPLWQRERQDHHGGASRLYPPNDELPYDPKGPGRSPMFCDLCTLQLYKDQEASRRCIKREESISIQSTDGTGTNKLKHVSNMENDFKEREE